MEEKRKISINKEELAKKTMKFIGKNKIKLLALGVGLGAAGLIINQIDENTYQIAILKESEDGIPIFSNKEKQGEPLGHIPGSSIVIVDDKESKLLGPDLYKVTSLKANGEEIEGYIEETYIDDKITQVKSDIDTTYAVTGTDEVNVRESPKFGDEYKKDTLLEGQQFIGTKEPIASTQNAFKWIKGIYVEYDEKKNKNTIEEGYIASDYLQEVEPSGISVNEYKIVETNGNVPLNLRQGPSTSEEIITSIENGSQVLVKGENYYDKDETEWAKVEYQDKDTGEIYYGYVSAEYLLPRMDNMEIEEKIVDTSSVNASGLNLRKSYSKNSATIVEIPNGAIVSVIKGEGKVREGHEWSRVEYTDLAGQKYMGWVYGIYLNNADDLIKQQVDTSSQHNVNLKMRENPSIQSEIKLQLPNGKIIYTTEKNLEKTIEADGHEWVKVSIEDGTSGYVAKEFLKVLEKEEENTNEQENVEDIKETEIEKNNEEEKNIDYNTETILGIEGSQVMGVDISENPENLRVLLENGITTNLSNEKEEKNMNINYVIIRLGASGYGENVSAAKPTGSTKPEMVAEMVKICEEYNVPYGYYYYSTCADSEEAIKEKDLIMKLMSSVESIYSQKEGKQIPNATLPFFVDVENHTDGEERQRVIRDGETKEDAIRRVTMGKATLINELAGIYGKDAVGLYTDRNAIGLYTDLNKVGPIIDRDILLKYLDNPELPVWLVNQVRHMGGITSAVARSNIEEFVDTMKNSGYNIVMNQRITDENGVDIDIMNEEYFKECLGNYAQKEHDVQQDGTDR